MSSIDIVQELFEPSNQSTYENTQQPRQRLRSWLNEQLEIESCPGCKWLDKDLKIFKLSWKHYGRPGFDEEKDAMIFREWARHTRRYSPGDQSDVSTWKTRFRNALHKMPDIEEMTIHHQLEGNDPYRVYRFRTAEEMERIREAQKTSIDFVNNSMSSEMFGSPYTQATTSPYTQQSPASSYQQPTSSPYQQSVLSPYPQSVPSPYSQSSTSSYAQSIPSPYTQSIQSPYAQSLPYTQAVSSPYSQSAETSYTQTSYNQRNIVIPIPHQLDQPQKSPDLNVIQAIKDYLTQKPKDSDISNGNNINGSNHFGDHDLDDLELIMEQITSNGDINHMMVNSGQDHLKVKNNNPINSSQISVTAIGIKLYYSEREVGSQLVNNINGVRIAYQPPPPVPQEIVDGEGAKQVLSNVFGPLEAEQIYYPHSDDPNTQQTLNWIRRGLVIEVTDTGDIYAKRLCQAKLFYGDSSLTSPVELVRSKKTLLFSYLNEFIPLLDAYKRGSNGPPSFEKVFSFAQKWSTLEPLQEMLVHCSVTHFLSKKKFKDVKAEKPSQVYLSEQNYDDLIELKMKKIALADNAL